MGDFDLLNDFTITLLYVSEIEYKCHYNARILFYVCGG